MSFSVQKDVEEGKIKINNVEFFRTQKRIQLFYKLTTQIFLSSNKFINRLN